MDKNEEVIPLREVCKLVGVKPNTIREWAKKDKIVYIKTPTGQLVYPKSQFQNFNSNIFTSKKEKKIIYCRVSSSKQKDDLERQIKFLEERYPTYELITDCASGINWKRKGLKTILEYSMRGELKELVVAHRDRLCRFGFELIEWIVVCNGGKIKVLDDQEHKSGEQELAEDILSIIQVYNCKAMGKRRYKSKNSEN